VSPVPLSCKKSVVLREHVKAPCFGIQHAHPRGGVRAQGARGEARAYLARLLQLGVGVGTATAAGFLLGRTALPALFTADDKVGRAWLSLLLT
jgi:hypothetical protein